MAEEIRVYGTNWCPDCARAKKVLNQHQIAFKWIDIERDPEAADYVVKVNNGNRSVPTIIFPDGTRLVEPSNSELEKKIATGV
jgi:glutaredoxin-like protein